MQVFLFEFIYYLYYYRSGLIQARLAGARLATGEVLVFLDSHCECSKQWLEPLIERIQESRTSVLVPIIESISARNFEYTGSGYNFFQVCYHFFLILKLMFSL
jgi:polypeptide N-acetylgalactosaminyltransferase